MSNDTPLTVEQRVALADTFGFMRDLCNTASGALSGLQAQAVPRAPDGDDRGISSQAIIIMKCKPIDLPQPPPTSSGDGCYLPEGLPGDFEGVVSVEGLTRIFEHLASICREVLAEVGGGGPETS